MGSLFEILDKMQNKTGRKKVNLEVRFDMLGVGKATCIRRLYKQEVWKLEWQTRTLQRLLAFVRGNLLAVPVRLHFFLILGLVLFGLSLEFH